MKIRFLKLRNNIKSNITLYATFSALLSSLILSMVLLAIMGNNPFTAASDLITSVINNKYLGGEIFVYGCPFLLAGLGIGLALKAHYWNLGAEGQLWWGALFGTLTGIYVTGLPMPLHLLLVLVSSFLGGLLWALPPTILKQKFGVNEILSNLLFNPVAVIFMSFLLWGPLKDPSREYPQSLPLLSTAHFPTIFPGTRVHAGIFIGFIAVIIVYIILYHTVLGFEIRAVGDNQKAAAYNGINVNAVIYRASAIAGGLAGLAGGIMVTSIQSQLMVGMFPGNGFSGYGFTAIPVALLGQLNPFGIFFSSLLFGMLEAMGHVMQVQIGVSKYFVDLLAGMIVIFVLYSNYITWKVKKLHD